MANLYLTEQGSVITKIGNRLIVRKDNEALLSKSGRLKGQLTSPFTKNIELRVD